MYNTMTSKKCPRCGTTVNVYTSMILTSNPPCYEWTCPNCGEKGYTSKGDVVSFGGKISVVTGDGIIEAENIETPQSCDIPAPKWIQQGWECPKCGAILAPHQNCCPFCSPSEYGKTNTIGTGVTSTTPYGKGVTWKLKQ